MRVKYSSVSISFLIPVAVGKVNEILKQHRAPKTIRNCLNRGKAPRENQF